MKEKKQGKARDDCGKRMKQIIFRKFEKRDIYALVFSGLISTMLVLGREMTQYRMLLTPMAKLAVRFVGVWVGLSAVTLGLWRLLELLRFREPAERKPLRPWVVFLVLFAGFLPMWLINFPGTFTGDTTMQLAEYEQGCVSQSFPVLHTVFVGAFVTAGRAIFGSYNGGIALAVFVQLLILSGILTYSVLFFDRRSAFPHAGTVLMLLYIFSPVLQLFSKDLTRDTLFSAFALLSGFLLHEAVYEPETLFARPLRPVFFASAMFAMLLGRNAAIALFALELAVAAIALLKEKRPGYKKSLALLAAVLALWGGWKGVVCDRVTLRNSPFEGIAESGIKENLSVPIQQVIRAAYFNWNTLPEEDKETILEMFPEGMIVSYNDDCADVAKAGFDQNKFKANRQRYIREWLRLGLRYKRSFLEAFLVLNTEGYYPDTVFDGGDIYGDASYYSGGTDAPGHPAPVFPKAFRSLSELTADGHRLSCLKGLFSPAVMLYILLFAGFYSLYRKGRGGILLPAIFIHIGTLFGPMVCLRYYFASFLSVSPAIVLVLSPEILSEKTTEKE